MKITRKLKKKKNEDTNKKKNNNINYLSVANRYRFMREVGTDECTQGE